MPKQFLCPTCGWIHNENRMPENFRCPVCNTDGILFNEVIVENEIYRKETLHNSTQNKPYKKTLSLDECKEYVKNIKNLEVLCYQLERLRQSLQKKLNHAEYERKQAASVKPAEKPERNGLAENIFLSIIIAILAALAGAIAGVVIGFFRWIFSGEGFFHNFANGMDEPFKPYLISTVVFLSLFLGIPAFLLFLYSGVKSDSELEISLEKYERQEKERLAQIDKKETQVTVLRTSIQQCEQELIEAKTVLRKYYDLNFIYPKYRGIVPICTIYEYLESGRCFSLLGHEGAYNKYDNELHMNLIIEKLDDIIYSLDDIRASQRMLVNEIKRSNAMIDNLCNSMANIEQNTALTQYYSKVTATNTSYLAWLAYLDHKNDL